MAWLCGVYIVVCLLRQIPSSRPLQGDQGDQGPRVCCSLLLLEIVGKKKRFEMHEIPGIVFAQSGQTQQEVHCCRIKMGKENVKEAQRANFFFSDANRHICLVSARLEVAPFL